MLSLLSPARAADIILETVKALPTERVPLPDALGRVAAAAVRSPIDLPHWDNSAMDGFAVRSEDVGGNCPVELRVVEEIPAGGFPQRALARGQCAKIFTGAPVPDGSDGVVRQEDTTLLAADRVRVNDDRDARANIRCRGEDVRLGATVLTAGSEIGPAQLGVLASMAQERIEVHRRPRVALMASGNEIAGEGETEAILSGEKIASSNTYTLSAMVQQAGGIPIVMDVARDDPDDLRTRLLAAPEVDLLLTTGGVSVGDHDYLRPVMQELGAELKFWRLKTRPGAPVAFGLWRGVPWLGLPGNPVSTMVTFELLGRPAIRVLLGHSLPFRRAITVRTGEPIRLQARLTHFLRVMLEDADEEPVARLTGSQSSGVLMSMVKASALLVVPEGRLNVPAGERLPAIRLDETRHVSEAPY
ncbi:MAG: molybdopterin molybdotransferase MoeA [Gemmatimonadota bacterium]|nr:MAG: molybdopterin molybdotransferase MoeA [Gemmatimonadota bacterium]